MKPTGEEIQQARNVLALAREAKEVAEQAKALTYVGRFFKYSNSYSLEEGGRWWLYGAVTGANYGTPTGWTFQRTVSDIVEIKVQELINVAFGGWVEIPAEEFWAAAKALLEVIEPLLTYGGPQVKA